MEEVSQVEFEPLPVITDVENVTEAMVEEVSNGKGDNA